MLSLSSMVKEMTEENKRAEASRFQKNQENNLKKMQEIQQMLSISESSKLKVEDGDEMEDEFDEYLEQSLMKEADDLGIFDQSALEAQANIYDLALKKVHKEVEKIQIQKANEVQIDTSSGREESKV